MSRSTISSSIKKFCTKHYQFLLCLAFAAGWFYWFQWRPSEIRRSCELESARYYQSRFEEYDNDPTLDAGEIGDGFIAKQAADTLSEQRELNYNTCLRRNGINK